MSYGKLGRGPETWTYEAPGLVDTSAYPGLKFQSLQVGRSATCALGDDNNTYCWGYLNEEYVLTPKKMN